MSLKMKCVLAAATLFYVPAGAAMAATTFYTDRAAFDAATSALIIEDFSDNTLVAGLTFTSDVGFIGTNRFNDRPTPNGEETVWTFAPGVNAFGGDYNLSPGGAGNGLQFLVDGVNVGTELRVYTPTFFGFITDVAFTNVTVFAGTDNAPGAIAETHRMDNLSFGNSLTPPPSAVPLPAGFPLLLAGLGGFAFLRQSRKFG